MNKNVLAIRNHVAKLEAKVAELKALVEVMIPLHEASGCEAIVERARKAIQSGESK